MYNPEQEKRRSARIKKELVIRYCYDVDKWDTTTVNDISELGMCITTIKYFPPNAAISFFIKIPLKPFDWLDLKGKVVACEELGGKSGAHISDAYITRVEFVDLKNDQKELIRDYIAWFLKNDTWGKR